MRLDFSSQLKCQSSTVVLSLGIKYPMHDVICDIVYYYIIHIAASLENFTQTDKYYSAFDIICRNS